MDLKRLTFYDEFVLDSKFNVKGATKAKKNYILFKGRMLECKSHKDGCFTLLLTGNNKCKINVKLNKKDTYNTFGVLPNSELVEQIFVPIFNSRIDIDNVSNIMLNHKYNDLTLRQAKNVIIKKIRELDYPGSVNKDKISSYTLSEALKSYIVLKCIDNLMQL